MTLMEDNLTKQKFEIFMMLCAAGIDGNIKMSELKRILAEFDYATYNEVFQYFRKLDSPAWLSFFKKHKDEFLATEEDKAAFLADILDILAVDSEKYTLKEENFVKVLEMLLNDEL
jgi:hypothetical protein